MLRDHPKWRTAKGAVAGLLWHMVGPVPFEWLAALCLRLLPRGLRSRTPDDNRP